jgi:hypothetical protein
MGPARNRGAVEKQELDELEVSDKVGDAVGEPDAERDPERVGWSWKEVKKASMVLSAVVASRRGGRARWKEQKRLTASIHAASIHAAVATTLLYSFLFLSH